jgi:hypothetical protein
MGRRAVFAAASFGASALFAAASGADTNIPSGTTLVVNGPTFAPTGTLFINSDNGGNPAILEFDVPNVTVSGTGVLHLNAVGNVPPRAQINTGTGGVTVTLSNGVTIDGFGQVNAQLIDNGLISADVNGTDLVLQTFNETNNATLQAIGGGRLDISGITLTQGAAGLVFASNGSSVNFSNASVIGGTLNSASNAAVTFLGAPSLVSVQNNGNLNVLDGTTLSLGGSGFTNNGVVTINSTPGGNANSITATNSLTISGSGEIFLNANFSAPRAQLNTSGTAVITVGPNQLIDGYGLINAALVNNGTITADVNFVTPLSLQTNNMTNNALIQSISNGNLQIAGITLTQGSNGVLRANNSGGSFLINNSTIVGGALSSGSSSAVAVFGTSSAFVSVLNNGNLNVRDGTTLSLSGSGFTNNGLVTLNFDNGGNANTITALNSLTISGSGEIFLNANNSVPRAQLNTSGTAVITIGPQQLIDGWGQINAALVNNGTISADVNAPTPLILQNNNMTNNALIQSLSGANLQIVGISLTNNGLLLANNGSGFLISNGTVVGGTLNSGSSAAISLLGTSSAFVSLVNNGNLNLRDLTVLNLSGSGFTNNGVVTINFDNGGNANSIVADNSMTISGSGSIFLNANNSLPRAQLNTSGNAVLTIGSQQLIHGWGEINAALVNNGTITADVAAGTPLSLQTNNMTNQAVIQANNGANLQIVGITVTQNSDGLLLANNGSGFLINNGTIVGGTLNSGTASVIAVLGPSNTFTSVRNNGNVNLLDGTTLSLSGSGFTNSGAITINSNNGGSANSITAANSMTISGNGSIFLNANNSAARAQLNTSGNAVLTIGSQQLIHGWGQINASLVNNGTITADFVSGVPLVLQTNNMTNNALIQSLSGANLQIAGITLTQSPNAQLLANNGSGFLINSGTVTGGTLNSGTAAAIAVQGPSNSFVSVSNNANVNIVDNTTLSLGGSGFTNNGAVTINSSGGGNPNIITAANSLTISGNGSIVLNAVGDVLFRAQLNTVGNSVLTFGPQQLVHGLGEVNATFVNNGEIRADASNGTSLLIENSSSTNNAKLDAANNSLLDLTNVTVTQSGPGTISASDTSLVRLLGGVTISSGNLSTTGGAAIRSFSGINTFGGNLSDSALIQIIGGSTLKVTAGTWVDSGAVVVNADSSGNPATLDFANNTLLSGTGSIQLNAVGNVLGRAQLNTEVGIVLSQAAGHTIHGAGQINGDFSNAGNIIADGGAGLILEIDGGSKFNSGTTLATGGALLQIFNTAFNQSPGGQLVASNGGAVQFIGGATVSGGSLLTFTGGVIENTNGDNRIDSLTSQGALNVRGGTTLEVSGTFANNGIVTVNSDGSGNPAILQVDNSLTLAGSGTIRLNAAGNVGSRAQLNTVAGIVLTNGSQHTIAGVGQINADNFLNLGTLQGDVAGSTLFVNSNGFTNNGAIAALNGGQVNTSGTFSGTGGAIAGVGSNINVTSGTISLGFVIGAGSVTVGTGAGTATLNVNSLNVATAIVNGGGRLNLVPAIPRGTNFAGSITINSGGKLDVGNNDLLTTTAPGQVKTYLTSAYNGGPWNGATGITSSIATGNPVKFSVAYANLADQSAQDAGVTLINGGPIPNGQTLIRPVLTGDANMDGRVDFFDIVQLLGYKYNTGQAASYTDGDIDYSGKVDFFDITVVLSANYNTGVTFSSAAARAAPSLTRGTATAAPGAATPASTTIGVPGDGKPDFEYNPITGDLKFRTDGGTFTTTGGSASFVSSLTISSASGILLGGGASAAFAGGTGATLTSTLLSSALTNSPGFSDGFDIGLVLAPGLSAAALTADLTVKYQSLNGGSLKTADITVPEPAGLGLIAIGAAGLLRRSRKRPKRSV